MDESTLQLIVKAKDEASAQLKQVNGTLSGIKGGVGGLWKQMALYDIGKKLVSWGVNGVASLAKMAIGFGKMAVQSSMELQKVRVDLDTMTGSVAAGGKLFKELNKFESENSFEMPGVSAAAKSLLTFKVSSEKVTPVLRQLGDVAMGDNSKFQTLAATYGRVSSTGLMTSRDLMQLKRQGLDLVKIGADKAHISIAEFQKKMKDAPLTIKDLDQALKDATSSGGMYYGALDKQSNTVAGGLEKIKDAGMDALRAVVGFGEDGSVKAGSLFDRIQKFIPVLGKLTQGLVFFVQTGDFANDFMADVFKYLGMNREQVVKLATFMENLRKKMMELGKDGWDRMKEAVKWLGQNIPPFLKKIQPYIMDIVKAWGDMVKKVMEFWAVNKGWIIPVLKFLAVVLGVTLYIAFMALYKGIAFVIDIFNKVVLWIKGTGIPWFMKIYNAVADVVRNIITIFTGFWAIFGQLIMTYLSPIIAYWTYIWNMAVNIFKTTWEIAKNIFIIAWEAIKAYFKILWTFWTGIIKALGQLFTGDLGGAWETMKKTFIRIWDAIKDYFGRVWDGIKNIFKAGANGFIGTINAVIRALRKLKVEIPDWVKSVPGMGGIGGKTWSLSIPDIPYLAKGTPYVQEDGLAYIHKGEAVVQASENPNNPSSSVTNKMNLTIQINGFNQNTDTLVQKIINEVEKYQARKNSAQRLGAFPALR